VIGLEAVAGNARTRVLFLAIALQERDGVVFVGDLRRRSLLGESTLRWHLRKLQQHGLVRWDRDSGIVTPLVRRVEIGRVA
jgi:DNA-binding transcriptional ArsR family regulator